MASPRTINLPGSLADTQSYTLAPGLLQYVQSVYVEVDNTAGGDARPTLTLSEQSGVVIAKKRQGETIPAGDTGSATWALRLDDEGGGGSVTTGSKLGAYIADTQSIPDGGDSFAFAFDSGDALLNVSTATIPTFVKAGVYEVSVCMFQTFLAQHPGTLFAVLLSLNGSSAPGYVAQQSVSPTIGGTVPSAVASLPCIAFAGERIQVSCDQNSGIAIDFSCYLTVLKVGS